MGNRFWEFYLVRYLLGTIFAIVILFYLFYNYNDKISNSFFWSQESPQSAQLAISGFLFDTTYTLQDDKTSSLVKWMQEVSKSIGLENITDSFWPKNLNINLTQSGITVLTTIILSVAGFLYMYFSSMLILVLHGVRAVVINFWINDPEINQDVNENNNLVYQKIKEKMSGSIKSLKQFYEKERYISIFILLILLIVFLTITIIFFTDLWRHSVSIIIVIFAYLLLTTVYSLNYKFYEQLSEYRAKKERIESGLKLSEFFKKSKSEKNSEEEFIESYKHLREHGNAFGIIVCEILFAFWLVFWGFSFWAIFYWSLIGFSSWIFGTYLEVKIVSEYKKEE